MKTYLSSRRKSKVKLELIVQIVFFILVITSVFSLHQCVQKKDVGTKKESFGRLDGKVVSIYSLQNDNGIKICITNYGAIVQSLYVPDKYGNVEDIVLGYEKLEEYLKKSPYFGAIVGRYGNRIAGGTFVLEGMTYTLAKNDGANHLHGGIRGFDKVVWDAAPYKDQNGIGVELHYLSKDGEEGYPGNLEVTVKYILTDANELQIKYSAVTDKATPCNLTHHGYFNLSGHLGNQILDHILWINADYFTPIDETLIPTGELRRVTGTPFDFTSPVKIGSRIGEENRQLKYGRGYDHNWVLNDADGSLKLQTFLYHPQTGRKMEVYTTEPGLQFYSGNFLDGSIIGKNKTVYGYRSGLCLETQHFPDSPNHPEFPSSILHPGEKYSSETVYKFIIE